MKRAKITFAQVVGVGVVSTDIEDEFLSFYRPKRFKAIMTRRPSVERMIKRR